MTIGNDLVESCDDHIDDDEEDKEQFVRDDEYMQVEESDEHPEEHKPTIQQQLNYYLDNFGGKDNPIVF